MPYTPAQHVILAGFGQRVRDARDARGWTQQVLAEHAGIDRSYVGRIELGKINLSLLLINKLAVALREDFYGFLPCLAQAQVEVTPKLTSTPKPVKLINQI